MQSFLEWFQLNSPLIVLVLFAIYIITIRPPTIQGWQAFLDSFESKGAQLLILWVSDFLVVILLVRFWSKFDSQLQTTMVGILSGINGAFLGALGSHATSNGGNGAPPKPDKLAASVVPPVPGK